jgi:hypothetical protein
MNRRIFLRGVAGATLAAPFLSSLQPKPAKGAAGDAIKRLVIFYTHNGCLTNRWFPTKVDGALTADDLATTTLAPLKDMTGKLLIPRGFQAMNAYGTNQTIDPHDQAMGSKLTCALLNDDTQRYATAPSLDHVIAKQINPNAVDPLVVGVGSSSTNIKEVLSFSDAGTAFPPTTNPTTLYNALTGVFGTVTPTTPTPTTEADYRVMRGQSIIDLVRGDLSRYQALKMSANDQGRVKDWLDLLRDVETTVTPAACNADAAAMLGVTADTVKAAGGGSGFGAGLGTAMTTGFDLMMKLIALNMICDTNRSIILTTPGFVTFNWDNIVHDKDHHGLSHRNGSAAVGGECHPGVIDMIAQIDTFYAGKYAKLVSLFDSIQEGDVKLLDNTATMWLPELSDGNAHNLNNLPIIIAGSAGGYLKTGAIVNVDTKAPDNGNSEADCSGTDTSVGFGTGSNGGKFPINKLYVTLMNAVGCTDGGQKVTKFGQFDTNKTDAGITNPGEIATLVAAG